MGKHQSAMQKSRDQDREQMGQAAAVALLLSLQPLKLLTTFSKAMAKAGLVS